MCISSWKITLKLHTTRGQRWEQDLGDSEEGLSLPIMCSSVRNMQQDHPLQFRSSNHCLLQASLGTEDSGPSCAMPPRELSCWPPHGSLGSYFTQVCSKVPVGCSHTLPGCWYPGQEFFLIISYGFFPFKLRG